PVQVSGLSGVAAIAAGGTHSLALKGDGTAWAWGANADGELGDGTNTQRLVPVQVSGLTGVAAVAGGGTHSLALKGDGTAWAWGDDNFGQLGNGTADDSVHPTPAQVAGLGGVTVIAAGGGGAHNLALQGGAVWAWGENDQGQLGARTSESCTWA